MSKERLLVISSVLLFIEVILLHSIPFFWDATSKAIRANWFLETNFQQLVLPTNLNSGHPPLWPILLAFSWQLFGKSLLISRVLLAIINFGVLYQIIRIIKYYIPNRLHLIAFLLIILEPTFLAQTSNLNNDMLLLFFTLLAYNSIIIERKSVLLSIALIGLVFSNLRGIPIFLCMLLIELLNQYKWIKKVDYLQLLPFLISGLLLLGFFVYQYLELGWIISTPAEGWSEHRNILPLSGMLRNIVIIAFNFSIFGKFFLFIILFGLLFLYTKSQNFIPKLNQLIVLIAILIIGISIFMIPFSNPISVRYYMIVFILSVVLTIMLIDHIDLKINKNLVYGSLAFVFLTGHFWVFPPKISQPWDSSFAYLNYFPIEKKLINYLNENEISTNLTGTYLPLNIRGVSYLNDTMQFRKFQEINFETNQFIIHSNIENRTKDQGIDTLKQKWKHIKRFSQNAVFIDIYKRPNSSIQQSDVYISQ